jgi:uncharacterized cupredoxin-like copper-binding protein
MKTTMRRAVLATAGLAVTGGLVFGATEAFASSAPATASATALASGASAPNAADATATGSAAGKTAACKDAKHPARCALRRRGERDRIALLKKGEHGQNTVKDASGAYVVHEWQVGKVTAVSGTSVTVASGDGTSWTWTAQSTTTVRVSGKKATGSLGGVHAGDTILVRGQRSGSANDAKTLVDPDQSKLAAKLG